MAIILTFSTSFYIQYNEQVYNLLLFFTFTLISMYKPGAENSFSCCLVYMELGRCLSAFGLSQYLLIICLKKCQERAWTPGGHTTHTCSLSQTH